VDAAYATYPSLRDGNSLLCKTASAVLAEFTADPEMAALMKTPDAPDEIVTTAVHRTATKLVEQGTFSDYESALTSLKTATGAPPEALRLEQISNQVCRSRRLKAVRKLSGRRGSTPLQTILQSSLRAPDRRS
jgi:hypothetical protein